MTEFQEVMQTQWYNQRRAQVSKEDSWLVQSYLNLLIMSVSFHHTSKSSWTCTPAFQWQPVKTLLLETTLRGNTLITRMNTVKSVAVNITADAQLWLLIAELISVQMKQQLYGCNQRYIRHVLPVMQSCNI